MFIKTMWGILVVVVCWLIGYSGIFCYCTNNFLRAKHANNSNSNNTIISFAWQMCSTILIVIIFIALINRSWPCFFPVTVRLIWRSKATCCVISSVWLVSLVTCLLILVCHDDSWCLSKFSVKCSVCPSETVNLWLMWKAQVPVAFSVVLRHC